MTSGLIPQCIRRIDALNPWLRFWRVDTGQYVSRRHAFLYPYSTVSERKP